MNAETAALLAQVVGEPLSRLADEVKRLNDNLEAGTLNIRTHPPLCVAPPAGDYTVRQLEVMSKGLKNALDSGALVLPPAEKEGEQG